MNMIGIKERYQNIDFEEPAHTKSQFIVSASNFLYIHGLANSLRGNDLPA